LAPYGGGALSYGGYLSWIDWKTRLSATPSRRGGEPRGRGENPRDAGFPGVMVPGVEEGPPPEGRGGLAAPDLGLQGSPKGLLLRDTGKPSRRRLSDAHEVGPARGRGCITCLHLSTECILLLCSGGRLGKEGGASSSNYEPDHPVRRGEYPSGTQAESVHPSATIPVARTSQPPPGAAQQATLVYVRLEAAPRALTEAQPPRD
jgi:hypothetical protein